MKEEKRKHSRFRLLTVNHAFIDKMVEVETDIAISGLIFPEETKIALSNALWRFTSSNEDLEEDSVGILVVGDSGLGKTALLKSLGNNLSRNHKKSMILDVSLLRSLSAGEGAKEIVDYFEFHEEVNEEKQLFLIDNLDAIVEAERVCK